MRAKAAKKRPEGKAKAKTAARAAAKAEAKSAVEAFLKVMDVMDGQNMQNKCYTTTI